MAHSVRARPLLRAVPTTEELLNAYLVQDTDILDEAHYPQHIETNEGRVTPLVEGSAYFAKLAERIDALGRGTAAENAREGIWIAGWAFDPDFALTGTGPPLTETLAEKAVAGVDVRILVWAGSFLVDSPFPLDAVGDAIGGDGPGAQRRAGSAARPAGSPPRLAGPARAGVATPAADKRSWTRPPAQCAICFVPRAGTGRRTFLRPFSCICPPGATSP